MEDFKKRVEAVLFTTGRFMDLQEIANLCSLGSVGVVRDALDSLRKDYESRDTALDLVEDNGKWKLNIRKEYNYLTVKLLDSSEMDKPTQETLALIAYKNPAVQSEIVKMRGNSSYDHIHFLEESLFITSEKQGRTKILKLAPKFFEYFDVVEDQLKSKLSSLNSGYAQSASPPDLLQSQDNNPVRESNEVASAQESKEGDVSANNAEENI